MKQRRGKNEGTIYKHKDGRWRAHVPAAYSPTGRRQTLVGSQRDGNTRESLAIRLAAALSGPSHHTLPSSRDTVATYLKRWLSAVDVRPKTLETYSSTVKNHIVPAIGGLKLQALQPHHVRVMMSKIKARKYALRTVAYARSILRIALKEAKRDGLVMRNVADREYVDPPKVPKAEIKFLNIKEAKKVLAALEGGPNEALISTILSFGLRIGEVLAIRWRDVDFDQKTIRIHRAVQRQENVGLVFVPVKTEKSKRVLLMPKRLAKLLKVQRVEQKKRRVRLGEVWQENDLLFPSSIGTPRDPRNALRIFHAVLKTTGLSQRGLHALRHSAATILLAQGVPLDVVSDMLGHSSIRVTADTYAHFVLSRQEQAAKVMDRSVLG